MVLCRWSPSRKWHGPLIGDEIFLRLVLGQLGHDNFSGHTKIDSMKTVFNGKVTKVGIVWLSNSQGRVYATTGGPQGCTTVCNACGLGPLGRRIRREEVLYALLAKSAGSLVCGSCFRHRRTRTARDKAVSLMVHTWRVKAASMCVVVSVNSIE